MEMFGGKEYGTTGGGRKGNVTRKREWKYEEEEGKEMDGKQM